MNTKKCCALTVLGLGLVLNAHAASLLECQDPHLAAMDTQQISDSLRAAGGEECNLHAHSWGDVVSCERTHARAFGQPVKELSAEIHQSGLRTLMLVLPGSHARPDQDSAASGLRMEVGSREDGTTTVRCTAGTADTGTISGRVPVLPPGASHWEVCAQPAAGTPICSNASADGRYTVSGLGAGEYGLIATPHAAVDPLLRAMLVREQPLGVNREGGPTVLAERINVRSGAHAQASELRLLRLPPQR